MANSNEYWRDREEQWRQKNMQNEEQYAKEIENIYSYSINQILREIEAFYQRYATSEGISIAEAKKRVKEVDINAYSEKAKKYVEEKDFSEQANAEMRLYNLTMKINRLELLMANIALESTAATDQARRFGQFIMSEETIEEFKRQSGILGSTVFYNEKMVDAIVNGSFKNATFSERIWANQELLLDELKKALTRGLINGTSYNKLITEFKKIFESSTYNTKRLIVTELARVRTAAQKESLERNGFEQYKFIAEPTACSICQSLDDKVFATTDMMPGTNAAPMHPNCRCSTTAYYRIKDK